MSNACHQEPHVRLAAAEGVWSESLRAHVQSCPDCAAAASVAPFLTRFSRVNIREQALPDPNVIWIKAQILGASSAVERVTRPLNIVQLLGYLSVAAGWAAVLTWKWSDLQRWILTLTPSQLAASASGSGGVLSATFLFTVVILASMTVMLALHTILAEE